MRSGLVSAPDVKEQRVVVLGITAESVVIAGCAVELGISGVLHADTDIPVIRKLHRHPERFVGKAAGPRVAREVSVNPRHSWVADNGSSTRRIETGGLVQGIRGPAAIEKPERKSV